MDGRMDGYMGEYLTALSPRQWPSACPKQGCVGYSRKGRCVSHWGQAAVFTVIFNTTHSSTQGTNTSQRPRAHISLVASPKQVTADDL